MIVVVNDKVITGKYCDKNESQEDIKRAGDIIKDSEQCDVVLIHRRVYLGFGVD